MSATCASIASRSATIALLVALVASWALFAIYQWAWLPHRRQEALLKVAGLTYATGPVVLVGDSVIDPVVVCKGVVNLAVPGSKAADLTSHYGEAIAASAPARIVVLIGINDLREGATPETVTEGVSSFVAALRRLAPRMQIIVLSILPVVESARNATLNSAVRTTNARLRTSIVANLADYADLTGLFGGDSLDPSLTYDGLHLNSLGAAKLSEALFGGLAHPRTAGACTQR